MEKAQDEARPEDSAASNSLEATKDSGPAATADNVDTNDYFFDWEIIDLIVEKTNWCAIQFLRTHHASHLKTWREIGRKELMTFFALIILQDVIEKPNVKLYWSTR
ncbi:hypothetical protein IscW_ISCW012079 [Ixodes scapularis]|uniref:PiggyBac transposable element-derived protein domain-containing protein n=1 Tax=Ixodes scapularis TaxID=6945 RepID=B7QAD1_IXOSC|nr:hypothetical protein IscW_ISCW012079 [Ixodes scapularis]|eukprot:XP_002400473.1 hypothetical protein IscW_ISCW012079 [Ixodes scapularis]